MSDYTAFPVRAALINVRYLFNKTFVFSDFFMAHALDFLLLTEIWLNIGELAPFELCLDD